MAGPSSAKGSEFPGPDDNHGKGEVVLAARRKHGGGQRIAFMVAQGQEHRHGLAQMRLQPDIAFDRIGGIRLIVLARLGVLAAEIFVHRMAHRFGFLDRFGFRLDPEPGLTLRRVADIFHVASLLIRLSTCGRVYTRCVGRVIGNAWDGRAVPPARG